MTQISVFLADDHELVRYALRTVIEDEGDIVVVGEGHDSASTLEGVLATRPDVLVLDLRMPGDGGVEVCRAVRDALPLTAVLILTSYDEEEEIFGVLSAGACGYLLKDTRPDRIVNAIRAVHDGQAIFDSGVAGRLISGQATHPAQIAEPLSDREMQVLECMAKGMSNKEIGSTLWIGETTVKTHVSHVLRKLGQPDRTQAVLAAVKAGLVRLG